MAISQSNLPQFIGKLYSILNDPRYVNYIRWGFDGKSFIIVDPTEFSNGVLAEHFKHSNMSSFVRQLNKYDFHKVKSNENSKMKFGSSMWEFAHKNFRKDRIDLIGLISRKPSVPDRASTKEKAEIDMSQNYNSVFYSYVVNTMANITKYFEMISEDLNLVKKFILEKNLTSESSVPKVLIAEDNASCATYASSIFKRNNFITVSAESVNELKFLLGNTKFAMILISSCIPDVSKIIKNIRMGNPTVSIILTAEEAEKNDGILFQYHGVDRILYKPYLHEELINIIKKQQIILNTYVEDDNKRCKKKVYSSN